ncbi:hypothetical protein CON45_17550 [Priestia megaterium]|uniref:glycosyltransferase family A protein n=1 Tax=Priestia megaterium TaxID=1404 RepID=UPI000BED3B4D|nr:glycosyltransferase family A protein [Priestia megaterium]PEA37634.1 hypothetical protein CON45_17550 [Priestia megaterium]PEE43127.1 hypothetical protein COM71_26705 [Priestia megaterium]
MFLYKVDRKENLKLKKIAICVCTYKRVNLLDKLINSLIVAREVFITNRNEEDFNVQVIIVDNDPEMSAESKVNYFMKDNPFINYYCESKSGLVMARNKCLEIGINNEYDYLAFIDDDEYVDKNWLDCMYKSLITTGAHIVFGKVETVYPPGCEEWIIKGGFFDKLQYADGTKNIISATANVLLDVSIVRKEKEYFDLTFNTTGGEDTYLFKSYLKKGYQSVWCQSGIVYDLVAVERLKEKYIYLRAYTSSYTYSEIQQKLGEEHLITSLTKGIIKTIIPLLYYPFVLTGKKEKKVSVKKDFFSGLGRFKVKRISRY